VMTSQNILLLFSFLRRIIPHLSGKTVAIGSLNERETDFATEHSNLGFEIFRTLRHMIQGMDEQQLLLNNQIFWCLISCLYTNNIALFSEALRALSVFFDRLDFQSSVVQNVYMASIPEVKIVGKN
jgi:hypothetical protein